MSRAVKTKVPKAQKQPKAKKVKVPPTKEEMTARLNEELHKLQNLRRSLTEDISKFSGQITADTKQLLEDEAQGLQEDIDAINEDLKAVASADNSAFEMKSVSQILTN